MGKYKDNWDKNNTTQFKIKLNNNTDCDIIDWLNRLDNKHGTSALIAVNILEEMAETIASTVANR